MQNTREYDQLTGALLDLMGLLNSPQRDEMLLRAAGVALDRALFPLLVRLGMEGPLSVAELAEQVGRDHSTVSRQLAKLEELGLITRRLETVDRRRRAARVTPEGATVVAAITATRERALSAALAGWPPRDRERLGQLLRRFADDLRAYGTDAG